jgi:hypothetical protein
LDGASEIKLRHNNKPLTDLSPLMAFINPTADTDGKPRNKYCLGREKMVKYT